MPQNNLGPKTGTFEPPSENKYSREPHLWDTVKKMHEEMLAKEKDYRNVFKLTKELISAYERGDKEEIARLIKEFEEIK